MVRDFRVNMTLSLGRIDMRLTPKTKKSLFQDLATSTKTHDSIYREEILKYT